MKVFSTFLKVILISSNFIFLQYSSFSNDFYIACYYFDSDKSLKNENSSLMTPSKVYLGAAVNYYWALTEKNDYLKLNGKIVDGFFMEEKLTQQEAVTACQTAITKGLALWKPKKTYRLFDYKATTSNYAGFEYPIRFLNETNNNSSQKIKQIVLFGDSLSDTGNLKRWTKYMPGYPGFFGRFSDYFVWIDFLSGMQANFGPSIPVLSFAYGGAKTDEANDFYAHNIKNFINSFGRNFVTGSSRDYIDKYTTSYLTKDSYNTKSPMISNPEETLFIIWIGANDYIAKMESDIMTQDFFDKPDDIGGANIVYKKSVNNVYDQIQDLESFGAKHFLVLNLPNFGKTPTTLETMYVDKTTNPQSDIANKLAFAQKISEIINKHNKYLAKKIDDLKKLDIDVTLVDVFMGFDNLLENKNFLNGSHFDYGFQKLDSDIIFPGSDIKIPKFCYTGGYTGAAKALTKSNYYANKYALESSCQISEKNESKQLDEISPFTIFWNSPHPSSYAHCWISYLARKKLEEKGYLEKSFSNLDEVKEYCINTVKSKYSK